ncbi:carbamoyltransferase [Streptomyces violaceoruber]|uniref:carbamoyltransferase family protein n=1 Tax=Streptomyces violaceoruber TaxID=1935 RepID=UPI003B4286B6
MRILGLSGLFGTEQDDYPPRVPTGFFHDAAAALVVDGVAVAAVEEERLNREKHTNKFPVLAAAACLNEAGLTVGDLDGVAYFFDEEFTDQELHLECLKDAKLPFRPSRQLIKERLTTALGPGLTPERIHFVPHHLTHAAAAFRDSGFEDSLVAVIDGNGEAEGVSFYEGRQGRLTLLRGYERRHSLGHFYAAVTRFIGYQDFDEYKVMGLASYGDPERFGPLLSGLLRLEPAGDYHLDVAGLPKLLLDSGLVPRRSRESFSQTYADLAAASQHLLEQAADHLLGYWRETTGLDRLAMAGGVAQNTTYNGRLLASGTFSEVFVHPASHDAGSALGAAYEVERRLGGEGEGTPRPLRSPYLGPGLGPADAIERQLDAWRPHITWRRMERPATETASLLAGGEVVAWVQGRSEFGPRALGNRSILADPREAANRDRVNLLVKKREEYRPLAPSVLDEAAEDLFLIPGTQADHGYMGFVVGVRPERRADLGAVTHTDGTARIQRVSRSANPRYHELIREFGLLTGVPVLLNTSFNNHAEPIVQDVDDAVTTLLTTGLSKLVVDDYLVECAASAPDEAFDRLVPRVPAFCQVETVVNARGSRVAIRRRNSTYGVDVDPETAALLVAATGAPLGELLLSISRQDVVRKEIQTLWEERLVSLRPATEAP